MKASMKKILTIFLKVLLVLILLIAVGVGVLTIAEYRPEALETVIENHAVNAEFRTGQELTMTIWNIGYGALGDNADFFMDGGSSVYTADRNRLQQNLDGIVSALQNEANADLILLQELDINSARSHGTDERTVLNRAMPNGTGAFAYNYKALYVPYPLPPLGHVECGLYTLSRAEIQEAKRVSLPCPFSWPVRTVNLKRSLLVSRIPLADTDRELAVINLHLEAYDDGPGREAQARKLLEVLLEEQEKGNYVIAAGDFNSQFSDIDNPYRSDGAPWTPGIIDTDAFAENGFRALMDTSVPTCRSLDKPLAGADPQNVYYYMIDGFIVSDNINVDQVRTLDMKFTFSDHNPVKMSFALLPPEEV
jgi:endonuclease/exonuclease/phosphatase family metal-dependent hydrolase